MCENLKKQVYAELDILEKCGCIIFVRLLESLVQRWEIDAALC